MLRRALFSPPGYTSIFYAHLSEAHSCPVAQPLFAAFRSFMLAPFGLDPAVTGPLGGRDDPLRLTFISRRKGEASPYLLWGAVW